MHHTFFVIVLINKGTTSKKPYISDSRQEIIVIIPTTFSPGNHCLLLLLFLALVLRDRIEQVLQLVLRDLLSQLARLRQHDETVFNIRCAGLLHETNAVQPVNGFWFKNLVHDGSASFRCLFPMW